MSICLVGVEKPKPSFVQKVTQITLHWTVKAEWKSHCVKLQMPKEIMEKMDPKMAVADISSADLRISCNVLQILNKFP